MEPTDATHESVSKLPFYKSLYFRVLVAIAAGALLGWVRPRWGVALQPFGELFVRLVKMVIAPVVFCTVAVGISAMGDLKRVGTVGAKALLYFEVVTTFALGIGLVIVEKVRPGDGIHANAARLDASSVAEYVARAQKHKPGLAGVVEQLVPEHFVGALANGEILQVLVLAILFGTALASLKERGKPMVDWLERASETLFAMVAIVMKFAPVGAFGAMAYTVGKFGVGTLANLAKLMGTFYLTSFLFVLLVLAPILRVFGGLSPWRFFRYLRDEFLLVLGTSSSESALPGLMTKLERLGCAKPVVGLVVPTGYSFNLDGTSIYLTMAAMFVAQATDTRLELHQKLSLLGVLLLTSKGAAAVSGGGFVTLAATLAATGNIPVAGLSLLLGIDRFMSEARALTNLAGNSVATVVVARWEGALDREKAKEVLGG
ncbi:MAG: C4-dicarboxylate transporter DctA [Myxococcales bacterium]|nr:C4-dicarboxylate transporter DctA [Myxococcales bacterium]